MSVSLLDLVLSFRSSDPGRRSIRCVYSKIAFLRGLLSITASLTGWVDRSRSSVFSNICIVCVSVVGSFIVGVRERLTVFCSCFGQLYSCYFGLGLFPF